jgi:serine/threonine protein kinase
MCSVKTKTETAPLLLNYYPMIEKVGSGSFGEVYIAEHPDGHQVAIKIENVKKNNRMGMEYKIYRHLKSRGFTMGVPEVYDLIKTPEYNVMVMELLGPNLEEIFEDRGNQFGIQTVLLIGLQIINLLENLHTSHYIHRDIKPSNFLINRNIWVEQIYIMDFGLSKKYISSGKHIPLKDDVTFIGTPRYASNNIHMKFEPSRRDDLESLGYMLIYFLKGRLPWQGIKRQMGKEYMDKVSEIKLCTPISRLCKGLPKCFQDYMLYCRGLRFHETPDYTYLRNLFIQTSTRMKITPRYEWCKHADQTTP